MLGHAAISELPVSALPAASTSVTLSVTKADLQPAGQSVSGVWAVGNDPASLSPSPKTVTLGEGTTVTAAALSPVGQAVAFALAAVVDKADVQPAGQDVTLTATSGSSETLTVDSAALALSPQDVTLTASEQTTEQPSGGYGWSNLAAIDRRRRKRELEEEADRLEMALAAEGLVTPSPEVVARHTVREYSPNVTSFSRRAQRAVAYAEKAQTAAAYQMALRQIQRELEDEETAVAMLLALVA